MQGRFLLQFSMLESVGGGERTGKRVVGRGDCQRDLVFIVEGEYFARGESPVIRALDVIEGDAAHV
jgi:hypothetical protein